MTVIFENADFWIDSLAWSVVTGAGAGLESVNIPIAKAGAFLGGSCQFGDITGNAMDQIHGIMLVNPGNNQIVVGDLLTVTGVKVRFEQLDATSRTVGGYCLLFMRKVRS